MSIWGLPGGISALGWVEQEQGLGQGAGRFHLSDWPSSQLNCGQAARAMTARTGKVTLCGSAPTSSCIFSIMARVYVLFGKKGK